MKKLLLVVYLGTMVGCVQQLNTNLQQSNELMQENIQVMTESRQAIEANTQEIRRSTENMQRFEVIFPIVLGLVIVILAYLAIKFFRSLKK